MNRPLSAFAAFAVAVLIAAPFTFEAVGQQTMAKDRQPPQKMSFREDVFPVLKGRCMDCHSPGSAGYDASGLDLRSYEGLMKGTKFGPMVIARDPESSNLMLLLDGRADPKIRMPHGTRRLSVCDRDAIRQWIREGALNN